VKEHVKAEVARSCTMLLLLLLLLRRDVSWAVAGAAIECTSCLVKQRDPQPQLKAAAAVSVSSRQQL
jgi:hypothetical protein